MRLYVVVRGDLEAPSPKWMVQASHACMEVFWEAERFAPERASRYRDEEAHAKIVVKAKNYDALMRAFEECRAVGIPCVTITDAARTVFPEPTMTCMGIGPCSYAELPKYVQKLQLLK